MKILVSLASLVLFSSTGRIITFDREPLGKMPAGWTPAMTNHGSPPQWEIRRDQSAPTQPYVLAQISNDPTSDRSPLAILNTMTLRDGDVSVRLKPVAGRMDGGGGLVWRYRDENNYYLAHANALQKVIEVEKVEKGRRIALTGAVKHEIPSGDWTILKVSARGDRFQIYLDHRRIMQCQDSTFRTPGKVGLWTAADSVTYFDDFRVYPK